MNHTRLPRKSPRIAAAAVQTPFALRTLAVSLMLSFASASNAAPAGGVVAAGTAAIATNGAKTTPPAGAA